MILFESAMELATIIMLHFVFIMHHKVPKTKEKRERERERERERDHPSLSS
jgi:Na+/H+ antiporter NhaD/arsenite permease-like protein